MTYLPIRSFDSKQADPALRVWVRRFGVVLLLGVVLAGSIFSAVSAAPLGQTATPTPSSHVVISEFRFTGSAGANDEFVEIFNPTAGNVTINGWKIRGTNNAGSVVTRYTFPASPVIQIQKGQHYLFVGSTFDDGVSSDGTLSSGITNDGGVAITLSDNTVIDAVGLSAGAVAAFSGAVLLAPLSTGSDQSYERLPGSAYGSCYDTDNSSDFHSITASDPQNSSVIYDECLISLLYTPTFTITPTETLTPTLTFTSTATLTPSQTLTQTLTPASTLTPTSTLTLTSTLSPTITPTSTSPKIIINEVAWSGTTASSTDEWIELYNPGSSAVNLSGWKLISLSGSISITLTGVIQGNDYYLLERTDDTTVSDVSADQFYSGALSDSGDFLSLHDPLNTLMDTANSNQGAWPAGSSSPIKCSMERLSATATDSDSGWLTNDNSVRMEHDANGNSICGSPRRQNWSYSVTPTPSPVFTSTKTGTITKTPTKTKTLINTKTPTKTRTPTITKTFTKTKTVTPSKTFTKTKTPTPAPLAISAVVINEFLVQPRSDWNLDGKVDAGDAFIEIKNVGSISAVMSGWYLDDQAGDSSPYYIPSMTLEAGARKVFFASETHILLSEASDSVRLYKPGAISDAYTYTGGMKIPNQTWCRLPDGANLSWRFGCQPTPNEKNMVAQTIIINDQTELAICLSKTIPGLYVDAECVAPGLAVWSPIYWLGSMQTDFPLYLERDDQLDIID